MNEQEKEQIKKEVKTELRKSAIKVLVMLLILACIVFGAYQIVKVVQKNIHTVTYEELEQYQTEIPITTENWKEYITFDDAMVHINTDKVYGYVTITLELINKDKLFYKDDTFEPITYTILANQGDGEISTLPGGFKSPITVDDFECTNIEGKLYKINLPNEVWDKGGFADIEIKKGTEIKTHGYQYLGDMSEKLKEIENK